MDIWFDSVTHIRHEYTSDGAKKLQSGVLAMTSKTSMSTIGCERMMVVLRSVNIKTRHLFIAGSRRYT